MCNFFLIRSFIKNINIQKLKFVNYSNIHIKNNVNVNLSVYFSTLKNVVAFHFSIICDLLAT